MPRKAAETSEAPDLADIPRRSTRISSQPAHQEAEAPAVNPKKASAKKAAPAKKRTLDEDAGEESPESAEEPAPAKAKKAKVDKEEVPTLAPIDIGDSLPSFTLKNEKDEDVDISTLTAEKGLVLFLVPKANTPGCNNQACGFRDIYPDFTSLNYQVYCLSFDTTAAQQKWQTKSELPYPLLSDRKRVLIKALTGSGTSTARSHFIFEKGGKLIDKKQPVKAKDSAPLALEFIKGLNKDEPMTEDA
jgi:peroxiredoxin Q/BCP